MPDERIRVVQSGTVTSPKGFLGGATFAGLKTYGEHKLDLGILHSQAPCTVAGVFTQNQVASSTVPLSRQRVEKGQVQAVVANSGCANACVGAQGMLDALEMSALAARKLGLPPDAVLIASTGIIGVELPMALIRKGIQKIELAPDGGHTFARAIMTTDSRPKEVAVRITLGGKEATIGAAVKGVGMIHPNMATMLCFVTSDAAVERGFLQEALLRTADRTFNMLSVDGDTSTNDMALVLCNGEAGNPIVQEGSADARLFEEALYEVLVSLTRIMARDGEGATKLIETTIEGAATLEDARKAARAVVRSCLVKAAIHGGDPNWGRVVCAIGSSGAKVDEAKMALYINGICMLDQGTPVPFFKDAAVLSMKGSDISIHARLGLGSQSATAWGCDLTEEYVRFNSAYTT